MLYVILVLAINMSFVTIFSIVDEQLNKNNYIGSNPKVWLSLLTSILWCLFLVLLK